MTSPRVAVCILNWNGMEDTLECLQSLRASTYTNLDVIVLDNGSRDDPSPIQEQFPEITLLREPRNLGYAGGNNAAAQAALERGAEYLLLLNNDTVVPPEMIERLVTTYQATPQAGLISPRERLHGDPAAPDRLGATWLPGSCKVRWLYGEAAEALPEALAVDTVSGCVVLLSREVAEATGLFDEAFFAYWEDTDLSLRVQAAGYRNYCATEAHVLHKSGRSTGSGSGPNLPQLYLVCRGQAIIARKHARGLAKLLVPLRLLLSAAQARAKGLRRPGYRGEMQAKLDGFRDGWLGRGPSERWIKR
jgi:GT2 family glycosyltransferase